MRDVNPWCETSIFLSMMLNAIEAMQDAGVTVRLPPQDGQLLFWVSDTGAGVQTASVDQIFSAFFTTKSQGRGMD